MAGGLVGCNHGRVSNCYSIGSVCGGDGWGAGAGGLVGTNGENGSITQSYSSGKVLGDENAADIGGLVEMTKAHR